MFFSVYRCCSFLFSSVHLCCSFLFFSVHLRWSVIIAIPHSSIYFLVRNPFPINNTILESVLFSRIAHSVFIGTSVTKS